MRRRPHRSPASRSRPSAADRGALSALVQAIGVEREREEQNRPVPRMGMTVGHFETDRGRIPFITLEGGGVHLAPTAEREHGTFAEYAGTRTPSEAEAGWMAAFQAGFPKGQAIPVVATARATVRCHLRGAHCELLVGTEGKPGWTTGTGPAGVPVAVHATLEQLTRETGGVLVSFADRMRERVVPPMFWVVPVVFTQEPIAAAGEPKQPTTVPKAGPVQERPPARAAAVPRPGMPQKVPSKEKGRRGPPGELAAFLRDLELEGKSVHTVRAYRHDLEAFARRYPKLKEVTTSEIRAYVRELQDRGMQAATVSRALATVKAFYRNLTENERIALNPAERVRLQRIPLGRPPNVLSLEEVDRLLDSVEPESAQGMRDQAILFLLYNTGIRAGELVALDQKDLHLKLRGEGELSVTGKGQRSRWIPLNRPLQNILREYLQARGEHDGPLFVSRVGGRFSTRGLYKLVTGYLKRAGIAKTGVHLLRHTFASHALQGAPNIRAIQELLGHRSILTTQRYTHVTREDLRKQVDCLPGNRSR